MRKGESRWTACPSSEVGLEGRDWDEVIAKSDTGTLFHTVAWTEAIARGFRHQARFYAFLDPSGVVKGLMPVTVYNRGPLRIAYSPVTIMTPYGGPACDSSDVPSALAVIRSLRRAESWDYIRIAIPPSAGAPQVVPGFETVPASTRIVPIGSDDAVWEGFNRRCKRYIKKAEAAGAVVRELRDLSFLPEYLGWAKAAYARTGERMPVPEAFYHAIGELVMPTESLLVRGAFVDGRPVTVEFFGLYRRYLYAIDSAMDRSTGVEGLGNLLTWDTMRMASRKGATQFDMLGTTIPRIAEYKQSFGGHVVPLTQLEWTSRVFRVAKGIRNRLGGVGG